MEQITYHTNKNIIYRFEPNYKDGKTFVFNLDSKEVFILSKVTYYILDFFEEVHDTEDLIKMLRTLIKSNNLTESYYGKLIEFFQKLKELNFIVEDGT